MTLGRNENWQVYLELVSKSSLITSCVSKTPFSTVRLIGLVTRIGMDISWLSLRESSVSSVSSLEENKNVILRFCWQSEKRCYLSVGLSSSSSMACCRSAHQSPLNALHLLLHLQLKNGIKFFLLLEKDI